MTTTERAAGAPPALDPIDTLESEHREAEALLERLAEADDGERGPLVAELDAALRRHMRIEETVIYPVVVRTIGKDEADEAETEHELAREALRQLRELAPDAPGVDAAVEMLRAGISHHVEEEESDVFPKLRRVDDDTYRAMADEFAAACAREDDLGSLTRDQLLERARELDIVGRSSMTKRELVQALRDA
jgi:iron-sulfur cluster repair protein YtfE (RIC family)